MSTAEGQKYYSILSSAMVAKEWYERMRQISCVVLALKKAGFHLCGVLFFLFGRRLRHKNSSTYFLVLLAILLDKTYIQLSVNYRPSLQFFSVLRFSRSFFTINESQAALKAKASNSQHASPAVHDEDDPGQNTSPTMLLILSALPASVTSSNTLLQELVQQKRQSTSSETAHSSAKRKKRDSDESGRAIAIASDKAKTTTSKELHDSASDKAHPKLQDDDALILFGDYSLVDEPLEPEDELNNDGLLTQITTSLSSSDESGPPVSDKLSKLVNGKFHTEYSIDKRKEILQKYKTLSNCTELFVPKVNPEIWGNLSANSKRSDIRVSVLQDALIKVSSAIVVSVEDLLSHQEKKTSPNYRSLIPRLTDSVALLGHVNKELSFKRRDAIRPYLNQEFKQACPRTLKQGKLLFNEDLPKTLQELKTTNRLMSNNRGSVSQKNHHSGQVRGSQSQGHHSSKPFIGIKGEGGGNPIPQKKFNNSLVSIPRRISQRTKCHQNEGKRVPIDSSLIPYLRAKVNSFKGGQLSLHIHEWATLTTDALILQTISGECIEFIIPTV